MFFLLFLSGCAHSSNINSSVQKKSDSQPVTIESVQTNEGVCLIQKIKKVIEGNSMSPLLQNGATIDLLENYYKCGNPVEKGDLVAYHYGGDERPLIKMVRVNSADTIEASGSNLLVNEEILTNSVGKAYVFSQPEINMLSLYIREKHIPLNTFFIFGDNPSVSTDSRKFGAVSPADFLGKFETVVKND